MNKSTWKDTAEIVGIAAIVASLIFVGLQMRQSHEIAIADQYQNRADAALEFYLAQFQSDQMLTQRASQLSAAAEAGRLSGPIADAVEKEGPEHVALIYLRFRANMTIFDNYHFQYEEGFLRDKAWEAFRYRLKGILADEIRAAFYTANPSGFRESFQELCGELLQELDNEPNQNEFGLLPEQTPSN